MVKAAFHRAELHLLDDSMMKVINPPTGNLSSTPGGDQKVIHTLCDAASALQRNKKC